MLSVMVAVSTGFSYDISAYGYESPLQQAYMMKEQTEVMNGELRYMDASRQVGAEHIQEAVKETDTVLQELRDKEAEEKARQEEAALVSAQSVQNTSVSANASDRDLLAMIVMAEAGCEDLQGQIMVANVVLNRARMGYGGCYSIADVIFAPGQFQPVSSGSIWSVSPSASVYEAVDRALAGEDYSQGALYFVSAYCDYSWFMQDLIFVTQHGGHMFFR